MKQIFQEIKKVLVLFIKYPSFTSVKKVTPLPKSIIYYNCVFLSCEILCWMVLSMSSIQHQHPFPTFMKIFFKYTHTKCMKATQRPHYHHTLHAGIFFICGFLCAFGRDTAFVIIHLHVLWLVVHLKLAWTNIPAVVPIHDTDFLFVTVCIF